MTEFTQDNTAGFTDAELEFMNDAFEHEMQLALIGLQPGQHTYLIEDMAKNIAEQVLKRHGGA